jgi:hypothetical protein
MPVCTILVIKLDYVIVPNHQGHTPIEKAEFLSTDKRQ